MSSAREFLLLALIVLLGVAKGVEDGNHGKQTVCDVTNVSGQLANVDCFLTICKGFMGLKNRTFSEHQRNNKSVSTKSNQERYLNNFGSLRKSVPLKTLKNSTNTSTQQNNQARDDHNFDSVGKNLTLRDNIFKPKFKDKELNKEERVNSKSVNKSMLNNTMRNINTEKHLYNCTRELSTENLKHLRNVTTLNVNLLNSTAIDMSSFPNVNTLFIRSNNLTLLKVYGAEHVLAMSVISSQLQNTSFINYFKSVKYLNLTDNSLKSIFVSHFPSSMVSIDLSHNSITLNESIQLPENLQFLNLSCNKIKTVEGVVYKGNVKTLDISRNSLVQVPKLIMKDVEELYISSNNISVLKYGCFVNMSSLTLLDLKHNLLTSLEEKVFEGLNKLQLLDLSQNKITALATASFQYLNNLLALSLSGNTNLGKLQDIEDASFLFGTGQRLQTIEASKTNLLRIPSTLTRSVRKLLLRNNKISYIQCGEMDSFPLIQVMDLSNNLITEVEEDALGRLDFLSYLLLYGNKLINIPKSLPNQLQVLDLRSNLINKLHNTDFLELQKLKVLLLSKNRISSIEDGAFGQLVSVEVLDLSYNPIKSLSRTSFIGPRKLKEMYLISLTDIIPLQEPLSFPAPESAHLEVLNMESSPVLATQLMDDTAALTMFHELFELNLNNCNLSTLRSDLPKYLPRLHKLELTGNKINCTDIIWLVRWLQTLNISMQESRKIRKEVYNIKYICEDANVAESYDQASVVCSSPENLSGRQIISLKEEDFPDLKLTSSLLPFREVLITEPYLLQTFPELKPRPTEFIDYSSITSLIYNVTDTESKLSNLTPTSPATHIVYELKTTTQRPSNRKTMSLENTLTSKPLIAKLSETKPLKLNKVVKSENQATKIWKQSREPPSTGLFVLPTNKTDGIVDGLDHINDSISSDAFLSHDPLKSSHPGMVLFLLVVGVIIITASFMVYSQCTQGWRGRDYHPQQDIEVSSLGGSDLW